MKGVKIIKKPNYFLKAEILENNKNLLHYMKKYSYIVFKNWEGKNIIYYDEKRDIYKSMPLSVIKFDNVKENLQMALDNQLYEEKILNTMKFYLKYSTKEEIEESIKINNATYKRFARLKERIKTYLYYDNAMFITLTFNEDTLSNTSQETRCKYVKRYLKDNCLNYVANIDYGKRNEREHYHAVVVPKTKMNYSSWHKLGAIKGQKIYSPNEEKLSMYITKLTNHAIKETNRTCMVIYSRD